MDDVRLVQAVFNLTGLNLRNGLSQIWGDRTGFRCRHKTFGAEDLTQAADDAHHVGRGDDDVVIKEVFLLDSVHHILRANVIGAGVKGFLLTIFLAEDKDLAGFARAVGQDDGAADLLIGVTGVNAQLDMEFDRLVKLGLRRVDDKAERVGCIILLCSVNELCALFIIFSSIHALALHDNAHAAGGTCDHAHRRFKVGGVQVGHFNLGDLLDFIL